MLPQSGRVSFMVALALPRVRTETAGFRHLPMTQPRIDLRMRKTV